MSKVQFNAQIPPTLAQKIRADARRNGRTLDDVTTCILTDFFSGWTATERAKFYEHAKPKVRGRKIFLAE